MAAELDVLPVTMPASKLCHWYAPLTCPVLACNFDANLSPQEWQQIEIHGESEKMLFCDINEAFVNGQTMTPSTRVLIAFVLYSSFGNYWCEPRFRI